MKVPYVGITAATAEKITATDKALMRARLLPRLSPSIPHANDPAASASKVIATIKKENVL